MIPDKLKTTGGVFRLTKKNTLSGLRACHRQGEESRQALMQFKIHLGFMYFFSGLGNKICFCSLIFKTRLLGLRCILQEYLRFTFTCRPGRRADSIACCLSSRVGCCRERLWRKCETGEGGKKSKQEPHFHYIPLSSL